MLFDVLTAVRRTRWLVLGLTLLGAAGALIASLLTPPTYEAQARVLVSLIADSPGALAQGGGATEERAGTYAELVTTDLVLERVAASTGSATINELAGKVNASVGLGTSLITINVRDDSASGATRLTDEVADSLVEVVQEIERGAAGVSSPIRLTVVQQAQEPSSSASPQPVLYAFTGGLLGLAVGVGVAMVRQRFDTTIRSASDAERALGVPVLASIPEAPHGETSADADSRVNLEAFRQLRTNLLPMVASTRISSIVITSSVSGEGTSYVSLHLARAFAFAGMRVALVDANLRDGQLGALLGSDKAFGLSDVLTGTAGVSAVIQRWGNVHPVSIIPSGERREDSSELLQSPLMRQLLSDLARDHELVLIDSPPLLATADAAVISQWADGVAVVVQSGMSTSGSLQDSRHVLTSVDAQTLGLVLNRTPPPTKLV